MIIQSIIWTYFTKSCFTDGFGVFDYNITDTIEVNAVRSYEIRFTQKSWSISLKVLILYLNGQIQCDESRDGNQ